MKKTIILLYIFGRNKGGRCMKRLNYGILLAISILVAIWFYWTGMGEELLNRISGKFMEERGDKSLIDAAVRKFKRGRER